MQLSKRRYKMNIMKNIVLIIAITIMAIQSYGATYVVTNNYDPGIIAGGDYSKYSGTLRWAIWMAEKTVEEDIININLPSNNQTILNKGEFVIRENVQIFGNGALLKSENSYWDKQERKRLKGMISVLSESKVVITDLNFYMDLSTNTTSSLVNGSWLTPLTVQNATLELSNATCTVIGTNMTVIPSQNSTFKMTDCILTGYNYRGIYDVANHVNSNTLVSFSNSEFRKSVSSDDVFHYARPTFLELGAQYSNGIELINGTGNSIGLFDIEIFESLDNGRTLIPILTITNTMIGEFIPIDDLVNKSIVMVATNQETKETSGFGKEVYVRPCELDPNFILNPNPVLRKAGMFLTYKGISPITSYSIDWGDGSSNSIGASLNYGEQVGHDYQTNGSYTVILTISNAICSEETSKNITVISPTCCETSMPIVGLLDQSSNGQTIGNLGTFQVNNNTGAIVFGRDGCMPSYEAIGCLKIKPNPWVKADVISASAMTFSDQWPYDAAIYDNNVSTEFAGLANDYENGTKNKWRPQEQYVYRDDLDPGSETYNYNKGTFDMVMFDKEGENVDQWVRTSKTTRFSPNGHPLEDENILGIKSTAQYGYNQTLPVLVAQNAYESSVAYESFENEYGNFFEHGLAYNSSNGTVTTSQAHTGLKSIALTSGADFQVATIQMSSRLETEGMLVRVWVRIPKTANGITKADGGTDNIFATMRISGGTTYNDQVAMVKIASSGEWGLYEALIYSYPAGILSTDKLDIAIKANVGSLHIDDARVQPLMSEMVTYVYDEAQRLTAVFDDQHFAMIYQYNAEGLLVRKLKETTKGIKTISGTNYNSGGETPGENHWNRTNTNY